MRKFFILGLLLIGTTSCLYRMPEKGELHTTPTTNNPTITRQSTKDWTPSIDY
jgi:hypothetical protein